MTSLTPRRFLSTAATPAHMAPTAMATATMSATCRTEGRATFPPTYAANRAARRYCPSTPMLNRFILKPIATATAAM